MEEDHPFVSLSCNLPGELMLEIVSRLPVKSLKKFKCVKKSWYSLINNPCFISKFNDHWSKVENHGFIVLGSNGTASEIGIIPSRSNKWKPTGIWKSGSFKLVGSSNGLICLTPMNDSNELILPNNGYSLDFWIINPSNRESKFTYRKLNLIDEHDKFEKLSVGFGFDHKHDDFKIVIVEQLRSASKIHVYSLYADTWKNVKCSENIKFSSYVAVYSGDLMYWVSQKRIVCFSLSNERFYFIPGIWDYCEILAWLNDTITTHMFNPEGKNVYSLWVTSPMENIEDPQNPCIEMSAWRKDRNYLKKLYLITAIRGNGDYIYKVLNFGKSTSRIYIHGKDDEVDPEVPEYTDGVFFQPYKESLVSVRRTENGSYCFDKAFERYTTFKSSILDYFI